MSIKKITVNEVTGGHFWTGIENIKENNAEIREIAKNTLVELNREINRERRHNTTGERWCEADREKAKLKARRRILTGMLEAYREAEPGGQLRAEVNRIIEAHKEIADRDSQYRTPHNVMVLKYIVKKPMPTKEIAKRLKIQEQTVETQLKKGLESLMVLYWGVCGIDFEECFSFDASDIPDLSFDVPEFEE